MFFCKIKHVVGLRRLNILIRLYCWSPDLAPIYLVLPSGVALSKLHDLSEHQFFHLYIGTKNIHLAV